ncbi:MAG TPA: endolytic transglycosylase MltG, partial [Rhodanobacteraceae bacterium]|nr:endolytic transglycosylase MltG [Rhodanobacteraceae bacterium]
MKHAGGIARWRVILVLLLLALGTAGALLWQDWTRFRDAPLAVPTQGLHLDIRRGTGFKQIVAQLQAEKLSAAPALYWRALAERMRVTDRLHAGEYALEPGLTPSALLRMLATGAVLQHHVTLVDGWTFRQFRAALDAAPELKHATDGLDDAEVMRRLDLADENPEGRFLPETYAYIKGDSDLDVLAHAHAAMEKLLAAAWPERTKGLPLKSPYEALILASIVEKETGRADERARIAGVFTRRLEIGMPLATDPTIIYGMGAAYHGNIRKRDLKTDTPYNTYLRAGLPPTPIAMPGKAAILAALHPQAGDDLYFVARGDGSGGHVFSASLRE